MASGIVGSRFGEGVVLVTISLMVLALAGCEPIAPSSSESTSNDDSVQSENPRSDSGLLLSEDSAISILQTYLQECVMSWNVEYETYLPDIPYLRHEMERGAPVPSEQEQMWWLDLATGATGELDWSAQYHEATEDAEIWVVIGPGFKRAARELAVVPGRWKVYSQQRIAYPLDAAARLAIEEYKKPLDSHFDPDCRGY